MTFTSKSRIDILVSNMSLRHGALALLLLPLALPAACSSVSEAEGCVPEEQRACQCAPGVEGFQTCNDAGTAFSTCACGTATSSSGMSTGTSTSTSGSGSSSGSGGGEPVCSATVSLLPHDVVDAEYSSALDKIIAVSASPAALQIIDAAQGTEQAVPLDLVPTAVSVSPDGLSAVVGHNARVSIVDLTTVSVTHLHTLTTNVLDVVYAPNGWVHAFPVSDQWQNIHSVEIATGDEDLSSGMYIYAGTKAKLHPGGTSMYGADNGLSPSDIERYDIGQGPASYAYDSPYHGDYEMCGDLWMSADGARIFTRCGYVFRASELEQQDMVYDGSVGVDLVLHLSHAPSRGEVAFIPEVPSYDALGTEDTVVRLVSDDFLTPISELPVPCVTVGPEQVTGHARFVFPLADGSGYAVLLEPEEGSASGGAYAVATLQP